MKITRLINSLAFISIMAILSSCSTQRQIKKANQRYEVGEYNKAATMYKRVTSRVKTKSQRAEIYYLIGNCYSNINNVTKASSSYKRAVRYNYNDPIIYLKYANVLYELNEVKEAKENYLLYLETDTGNTQAKNGILACDSISKWNLQTRYRVTEAKQFNARRSSNFCPVLVGDNNDVLYFTSNREGTTGGNALSPITGQRINDIYVSSKNLSNEWSDCEPVESINTEYDEGAPCFTADGKKMFFTRASSDKTKSLGATIYMSQRSGAEWGDPTLLEILTDSLADTLTFAHPAVSATGIQLIFASDLPNGYGGTDLWMVKQEGKNWSGPINLGPDINTSGNEMFPYLREDTVLYFSSDGHPGFGGLDIYRASKTNDTEWDVKNMGTPINSKNDDFGITFSKEDESGFFSSNRKDRKGYDRIYSFILPKLEFNFEGLITDDVTHEPIAGAVIKLIGNDGTNLKITSKKDGTYTYPLNKEVEYVYLATARGYLNESGEMNTLNAEKSIIHKTNFALTSIRQPIRLNNIFFDFASSELTEASSTELNELIKTLDDNPNITIEISAHSDAVGEDDVNMKLSQARAQSVVNYLIENGIDKGRLKAQGYGESQPVEVSETIADQYKFLNVGDILDEKFVNKLSNKNKEIAYSINRRTEFKVLSINYKKK